MMIKPRPQNDGQVSAEFIREKSSPVAMVLIWLILFKMRVLTMIGVGCPDVDIADELM